MTGPDLAACIRARLLNKAKTGQQDFNLILTRYALERLLCRLGRSTHVERFLPFELWVLARQADFDGAILTQALRATFDRRATPLPDGYPSVSPTDRIRAYNWYISLRPVSALHAQASISDRREGERYLKCDQPPDLRGTVFTGRVAAL